MGGTYRSSSWNVLLNSLSKSIRDRPLRPPQRESANSLASRSAGSAGVSSCLGYATVKAQDPLSPLPQMHVHGPMSTTNASIAHGVRFFRFEHQLLVSSIRSGAQRINYSNIFDRDFS